jgi:hypothetical protein
MRLNYTTDALAVAAMITNPANGNLYAVKAFAQNVAGGAQDVQADHSTSLDWFDHETQHGPPVIPKLRAQIKAAFDGPVRGQPSPSAVQMRRIVRHCNSGRCPICRRKLYDCRCG